MHACASHTGVQASCGKCRETTIHGGNVETIKDEYFNGIFIKM